MQEFDLIARYFSPPAPQGFTGVGDDCAILPQHPDQQWVISKDLLVQGQHFADDANPQALGHKALAVNISDLAAMGATPRACLLGLALPTSDKAWLQAFSDGFLAYARNTGCALIGGDTTRSHAGLHISVTVLGTVPNGQAMRRNAAQVGDDIWITDQLGAAHLAWQFSTGRWAAHRTNLSAHAPDALADIQTALDTPQPPWQLAKDLAQWAHAAVDISDGLVQDLGHILKASACGARLHLDALPAHPALARLPAHVQQEALLSGGEAYQLCLTAPPAHRARLASLGQQHCVQMTRVGKITNTGHLHILDGTGQPITVPRTGFDHFAATP